MTCHECGFEQDGGRYCGRCGSYLVRGAPEDPAPNFGVPQGETSPLATETSSRLRGRVGERAAGRLLAWSLGVALIVAVGSVTVWVTSQRERPPAADDPVETSGAEESGPAAESSAVPEVAETPADGASASPPERPAPRDGFGQATGTVLLFDDGDDGALAVDLDTWERTRVALPGQRPGAHPFRLWPMGRWVVVGSEQIWAGVPGQPDSARRLGDATVFLPHSEPGSLWLVDYADGEIGTGDSTWTLTDPSGAALVAVESAPAGLVPVRGVPGGLAVEAPNGSLLVYDLEQERLVDNPIGDTARLGDATRDHVAWCDDDPCEQVLITDREGVVVAALGTGETFDPSQVWLSPDGDRVAAGVRVQVGQGVDLRLHIYGTDDGELLADTQLMLGWVFGDWTVDGHQFFAWNHMPNPAGAPATLHRWAGGSEVEQVALSQHDIRGVYSFIAMPAPWLEGLFAAADPPS